MPRSCLSFVGSFVIFLLLGAKVGASTADRPTTAEPALRFGADTFSFANQTVYIYPHGYAEERKLAPNQKPPAFTLRCFAMCRSTEQFRKFARFEPSLPPPDDVTLNVLIRRINHRAVWRHALPPERRVVIPGYANLRALSEAKPLILQNNVGGGWTTYARPGNYRMLGYWWNGPPQQERTHRKLEDVLARNDLFIAYLTTYPSLSINHAVVVYGRQPAKRADLLRGTIRYLVYDPNHPEAPREMVWDQHQRAFSYQKDWDFVGGPVTVLQTYSFWLQ